MGRSVWAAVMTVEIDGLFIGIRTNSDHRNDWLAEVLRPWLVEDVAANPNYSLRVAEHEGELHQLYWGGCLVARDRSLDRMLDAVGMHLSGQRPPPRTVRVGGVLIREGDRTVVLCGVDRTLGWRVARRLAGSEAVPVPWIDIDPETTRVILPPGLRLAPEESPRTTLSLSGMAVPGAWFAARSEADALAALLGSAVVRPGAAGPSGVAKLLRSEVLSTHNEASVPRIVDFARAALE